MVIKCVVIAYGVHDSGRREIIGLHVGEAETEAFWSDVLRELVARGAGRRAAGHQQRQRGLNTAIAEGLGPSGAKATLLQRLHLDVIGQHSASIGSAGEAGQTRAARRRPVGGGAYSLSISTSVPSNSTKSYSIAAGRSAGGRPSLDFELALKSQSGAETARTIRIATRLRNLEVSDLQVLRGQDGSTTTP